MPIHWPRSLCPVTQTITPVTRSILGPPTLTGSQQAVASGAGAWRVEFDGIPLQTDERIEMWRALEVMIEGRVNPIVVPLNQRLASVPLLSGTATSASVTHSDGTGFSDGTAYWQSRAASDLVSGAEMGATLVEMSAAMIGTLRPGMMFSLIDRVYRIKSVETDDGVSSVRFWPPLREDVAAGEQAEFRALRCKMRLATDDAMSTPLLLGKVGVASVAFIEDTL